MVLAMDSSLDHHQLDAYLQRVGLTCVPPTNAAGLVELHHAQFFAIPFENFDVLSGRGIDLDPEMVFQKLVEDRRGGYCFELNGLMLRVLHTLGFDARPLLARVHLTDPPSGRTHQVNLVRFADADWIMDVGFGAGGPRAPLPLKEEVTNCGVARFGLSLEKPWGWMLRTLESEEWRPSYSFDLGHVTAEDIEVANHYTSTSPRTHFTQLATVSLPNAQGRISLRDLELTEIDGTDERRRQMEPGSYLDFLRDAFDIELRELPRTIG